MAVTATIRSLKHPGSASPMYRYIVPDSDLQDDLFNSPLYPISTLKPACPLWFFDLSLSIGKYKIKHGLYDVLNNQVILAMSAVDTPSAMHWMALDTKKLQCACDAPVASKSNCMISMDDWMHVINLLAKLVLIYQSPKAEHLLSNVRSKGDMFNVEKLSSPLSISAPVSPDVIKTTTIH